MRIDRYILTIETNTCVIQDYGMPDCDLVFEPFDRTMFLSLLMHVCKGSKSLSCTEVNILNQILKGNANKWISL